MSGEALLSAWLRPARARRFANDALLWLPGAVLAAAVAWRVLGLTEAVAVGLIGLALVVSIATWRTRLYDRRWLMRRLDAQRTDVEDSADLLFADEAELNPLEKLQRARLERRLAGEDGHDLRPEWQTRRIAGAWLAGLVGILVALLTPASVEQAPLAPSREGVVVPPGVPRLTGQRLQIVPPAYTGLPARSEANLDVRAPQGSQLSWTLRFDPQPRSADLIFHDGTRVSLRRDGDIWTAGRRLDRSALYRVVPAVGEGQPLPPLHRLDATPDALPQLRVLAPERSVTLWAPGQGGWSLLFEATDDYSVASAGQLRITVTEGEGENISFKERVITLGGSGAARRRRFAIRLDPAALGLTRGNDLVAQLTIRDLRSPSPHVVRGPGVILRWPLEPPAQGSGLDGLVKKVLPAYFRSQRQIIIDAEKLLREKPRLAEAVFAERSDKLGVDQRLLRLRYGQFLGEVASDAPAPPTNDSDGGEPAAAVDEDGHAAPAASPAFGNAEDVLSAYGHTHDESEAATLIDPETRAILKKALDEMWQSELHLRQADPRQALPYAYRALGFIKQVQQSQRIYLQRVGPELPPIDETRRMTGKREGLERRPLPPVPAAQIDAAPMQAWQALADVPGRARAAPPLDALEHWLRANEARVADPLSIVAAIDAVRQQPVCVPCRAKLRGLLWAALPRPPARVLRRDDGDAAGRRYLDALGGLR